jgi:hypothetical protein
MGSHHGWCRIEVPFRQRVLGDLLYALKTSRDMSTAYHSQNDGQTERLNSVLKQYLRSYANFGQMAPWPTPLIHHFDSCSA